MKFLVDGATEPRQGVLLRAAVTLLYSHWEGFVREAGTAYAELVARQGLSLGRLALSFVALSLRGLIRSCGQTSRTSIHVRLVDRVISGDNEPAHVPWKQSVKTRSNLDSRVLREITDTLGLDYSPFELKAKPVIDRLVWLRNGVAHGRGIPVSTTEYDDLHRETVSLLEEFKSLVGHSASMRAYERNAAKTT